MLPNQQNPSSFVPSPNMGANQQLNPQQQQQQMGMFGSMRQQPMTSIAGPPQMFGAPGSVEAAPRTVIGGPHSQFVQESQQPQRPPVQAQPARTEQKRLNPPPYPSHILKNLANESVEKLTNIGKELIQDITFRCLTLLNILKAADRDRRVAGVNDPNTIIEYCVQLLDHLLQIRIILDKNDKVSKKPFTNEDWIAHMSGATSFKRPDLKEKEEIAESNRLKLIELMTELKMVDWVASVSDPHQLASPEPLQ